MRFLGLALRPYALPVIAKAQSESFSKRHGTLVALRFEVDGRVIEGMGDCAPWPQEPFDSRLWDFCKRVLGQRTPRSVTEVFDCLGKLPGHPALRFAVETALLDALGQWRQKSVLALLMDWAGDENAVLASELACNALAFETADLLAKHEEGFLHAKLKVGGPRTGAEVAALLPKLPHGLRIRLDANGRWHGGDLQTLWDLPSSLLGAIDYIEEPLANADAYRDWTASHGEGKIALAADESLASAFVAAGGLFAQNQDVLEAAAEDAVVSVAPWAKAAILKPTRLGGGLAAWALIRACHERGIKTTLTNTWESGLGRLACLHWGLFYQAQSGAGPELFGPAGMGTPFEEDLVQLESRPVMSLPVAADKCGGLGCRVATDRTSSPCRQDAPTLVSPDDDSQ